MPKFRVNFKRAYAHTGVDYTGHYWVNDGGGTASKYYILIFTCLQVRAIHLQLVSDMSTKSFIQAFKRFTNLYGVPEALYSDNAKSFVASGKILSDILTSSEFTDHLQKDCIKHITIPMYAAWVGATWERMLRTIKSCLHKSIGRSSQSYFDLLTVLSDIERAINARPLTYKSKHNDLEVITPAHFTLGSVNKALVLPLTDVTPVWEAEPSREDLIHDLNTRQEMFYKFREMFQESYLLSLRELTSKLSKDGQVNAIKPGYVVLVKTPGRSRPFWSLGRVVEIIIGHDGLARSARVIRGDGKEHHYPLSLLYPMEMSILHPEMSSGGTERLDDAVLESANELGEDASKESNCPSSPDEEVTEDILPVESVARPSRRSAIEQRKRLLQWRDDGDV